MKFFRSCANCSGLSQLGQWPVAAQTVFKSVMSQQIKRFYEFDRFRIDLTERALLCDGEFVPLTQKAFEVLLALVERRGRIVSKEELMAKVWPDTFVEESNLTQNIYTLLMSGHIC
jgi:DNA-binding response OmpR family regulator